MLGSFYKKKDMKIIKYLMLINLKWKFGGKSKNKFFIKNTIEKGI